ncbi:hypothetical protein QMK19_04475 [Streptomyces sp. H10-C2]|uniref:hypothetical protein n=1 Tax=unclassified Streptomyces TaxID=2593676 RepID=UPI0024B95173|nr:MULTISPECIES: hypothetical protein [unclassified Streptomyces]MDJ0341735.1 hypothetical protein [Streptomyces sp. PH10-H1]MDJ0368957.1 hypothetical protein [Streptomyces sp. H10-C2]
MGADRARRTPDGCPSDPTKAQRSPWEVDNWEAEEVRRQDFTYRGSGDDRTPVLRLDTNPDYDHQDDDPDS